MEAQLGDLGLIGTPSPDCLLFPQVKSYNLNHPSNSDICRSVIIYDRNIVLASPQSLLTHPQQSYPWSWRLVLVGTGWPDITTTTDTADPFSTVAVLAMETTSSQWQVLQHNNAWIRATLSKHWLQNASDTVSWPQRMTCRGVEEGKRGVVVVVVDVDEWRREDSWPGDGRLDKRGRKGEWLGQEGETQRGETWGGEETVREKTLANCLPMLALVQARSPGSFVITMIFIFGHNSRWWWDEIAGTCKQFQWTGWVVLITLTDSVHQIFIKIEGKCCQIHQTAQIKVWR